MHSCIFSIYIYRRITRSVSYIGNCCYSISFKINCQSKFTNSLCYLEPDKDFIDRHVCRDGVELPPLAGVIVVAQVDAGKGGTLTGQPIRDDLLVK